MSAIGGKADIARTLRNVRFDPKRALAPHGKSMADRPHSALMLRVRMRLPHFSVSSPMSLPKSAGESASASPPRLASRALFFGSTRAALISLLSLSMISVGVAFGAPTPYQLLAS